MTPLLRALEARRHALVARSTVERDWISAQLAPAARKLATVDRFTAAVREHPVLAVLAAGSLALIGRGGPWRWALRALPIYAALRRLSAT